MKVHALRNQQGRVFAFEIDAGGRRRVCAVLRTVPGARLTRRPRWLSRFREHEFCVFEIDGVRFHAFEPFGDTPRYWIGPEDSRWHPEIDLVLETFKAARWRSRGRIAAALLIAAYAFLNVALIATTPILQSLELRVAVADERAQPVPESVVAIVDSPLLPNVRTGADGRAVLRLVYQQQPLWVFPRLGHADLQRFELRIGAPGRDAVRVNLSDALGRELPLSTRSVELEVRAGARRD